MLSNDELRSKTIGEIVASDFSTAATFEKYGVDFCCGGNRTISSACSEKNIPVEPLLDEVRTVLNASDKKSEQFESWDLDILGDYIISTHHTYVREKIPVIRNFSERVINAHGKRHPEVLGIASLFHKISAELESHLLKEERILFPRISQLAAARRYGKAIPGFQPGSVSSPIAVMEAEHTDAGEVLREISLLSNTYTPPEDACNTFRALYYELAAFEKDLHKHIHLENNILFPRAIALEKELVF